mgnify:CR=1 FL=1
MTDIIDFPRKHSARFLPVIAFPDDSAGFCLGYEAGLLFGRLDAGPDTWSGTYHADNVDMLRKTAATCGYDVKIEPSDDAMWVFADFTHKVMGPRPVRVKDSKGGW